MPFKLVTRENGMNIRALMYSSTETDLGRRTKIVFFSTFKMPAVASRRTLYTRWVDSYVMVTRRSCANLTMVCLMIREQASKVGRNHVKCDYWMTQKRREHPEESCR